MVVSFAWWHKKGSHWACFIVLNILALLVLIFEVWKVQKTDFLLSDEAVLFPIFIILQALAMFLYFWASTTNPGYLPRRSISEVAQINANNRCGEMAISSVQENSRLLPNAHSSTSIDIEHIVTQPSETGRDSPEVTPRYTSTSMNQFALQDDDTRTGDKKIVTPEGPRWCKICFICRPLRAKHCYDCNRCVIRFDHHCPFIANCVGAQNHHLFWWYLCIECVVLFWGLYMTFNTLGGIPGPSPHPARDAIGWLTHLVLLLFLAFSGMINVILFIFHSYLMFSNQTTYQYVKKPESSSEFDEGCFWNVRAFCFGRYPEEWQCPIGSSAINQTMLV